jgi:hypothetical protein
MDTGRCTVRVESTTGWPLLGDLDNRLDRQPDIHVVTVERVCDAWESPEPAVAEAAGVLRDLLRASLGDDVAVVLAGAIPSPGMLELTLDGVPTAVEMTRTRPAACVAFLPRVTPADRAAVLAGLMAAGGDARDRLREAVANLRDGMLVLRGYGWFDDRDTGAEAFGDEELVRCVAEPARLR